MAAKRQRKRELKAELRAAMSPLEATVMADPQVNEAAQRVSRPSPRASTTRR
jgi:hypothetical protein